MPVAQPSASRDGGPRLVAVIEAGSSSVRMVVAQVAADGTVQPLDSLQQTVALGKDAFTRGAIDPETTESCVKALKNFRHVLDEYRIPTSAVMAVATSAVREASNREAFLDRLFIATGIDVDAIDEAQATRYTFMGVLPVLSRTRALARGDTLVMEVGGGSTETLLFRKKRLRFAHTHRLGSLRLRQRLAEDRSAQSRLKDALRSHVEIAVADIHRTLGAVRPSSLLALGGDARFAAAALAQERTGEDVVRLDVRALEAWTDGILDTSVDDLARRFHLPYADAETLGTALLIYVATAREFRVKHVYVGHATLRDGVLAEMTRGGSWAEEFEREIVTSATEVGRRYRFERAHAEYVAELAGVLFDALREEHRLTGRCRIILRIAALLRNIGFYVSPRSHHKHSMYLIQHAEIFGMSAKDALLAALVARYHRRAFPNPAHEGYNTLGRDDRIQVLKLAAILRLADALGRGHRRPGGLTARVEPGGLTMRLDKTGDLALETQGLHEKARMFTDVYGMRCRLEGSAA